MTNLEHIRTLPPYELAIALVNFGEDMQCELCPRGERNENRCNEDCCNGMVEWLMSEYDPDSKVWKEFCT